MAKENQDKDKERSRSIVNCLMPLYSEVDFGLPAHETIWRQQAAVYASNECLEQKKLSFQHLLATNDRACVLVFGQVRKASTMYACAREIAYGKLPRIFNATEGPWNKEKCIVFSRYRFVICMDPPEDMPLMELQTAMGEYFSLLRDNTRFIVNKTTNKV